MSRVLTLSWIGALALPALMPTLAWAGNDEYDGDLIGIPELIARIGAENVPTGVGMLVGQVEVGDGQGDYTPPGGGVEFSGKTFVEQSGASGTSTHARNVGFNFYGNTISIAPGITEIHFWEAGDWLFGGFLNTQSGPSAIQPEDLPAPIRVLNHSWIASLNPGTANNDALRRADFVTNRDNLLMTNGVGNAGDPNIPLMSHMYNGLTVGKMNGAHQFGNTLGTVDGAGRMKPEIVAPGSATSWCAPVVGAAAVLLIETAENTPGLNGVNTTRTDVIKSVLLAGAAKRDEWTNNPVDNGGSRGLTTTPLDDVYGVDLVNVDNSHLILTSGEQDAATDAPPEAANADATGWDLTTMDSGEKHYYRFAVGEMIDEMSIIATWHRQINANFGTSSIANITLTLWRVDETGALVTLRGDPGLPYFESGNIISKSGVDNIEHIYIRGVAPADYVLEVARNDSAPGPWDVAVAWRMPETEVVPCPWDLNGSGSVGPDDLAQLLDSWGLVDVPADFDGGGVGPSDLATLLDNWGDC